jgi:mannose-6-phosphate isomerase-like protein (cupin superfamily)
MLRLDSNRSGIFRRIGVQVALVTIAGCASTSSLPDPLEAGWNGSPVCEQLLEDSDQRILRCTFPPGVGHERHYHVPHFGYTVAGGRMQITDSKEVREVDVPTGSSFTSDRIAWHEVMNTGNSTAVFLIVEQK